MRSIDADALKTYIDTQEGRPFIGCTVGEAMKIMVDEQPTVELAAERETTTATIGSGTSVIIVARRYTQKIDIVASAEGD